MSAALLQKEIQRQMAESSLVDGQIDTHQESVIQLLKQTIIEKHYYVQRLFMAESYYEGRCFNPSDILKEKVFVSENKKVYDNFAALDLPPDFSKGPMKAFLNTLLESLESFLPAFYCLTPSKLPSANCYSTPADVLVRCVFPTLFGYCWATEPATAYAENLVKWFGEIYQTKADFIGRFKNEWMFNAMRGFFTSLDFQAFIISAIRPVFLDYVQAKAVDQKKASNIMRWAKSILENCIENFELLPGVLNDLFSLLKDEIKRLTKDAGDEKADSEYKAMIRLLFYDGIIENFIKYPLLYVTEIPIPEVDWKDFYDVFRVFKISFGCEENIDESFVKSIKEQESFKDFDPMSILGKIEEKAAKGKLPSLQDFCNIVQCAHQPLLMTTHHLSLLFRFVASLQHLARLPQAIDRSIALVFTNSLADQLEVLDDEFFWFPCFSLKYMNIKSTTFEKQMSLSPIYRLLSNHDLHIRVDEDDFGKAISDAEEATNIATHPEIRTEINWLKYSVQDLNGLVPQLKEEMEKKKNEINQHRIRAKRLNIFARTLEAMIVGIPTKNPKIAIGFALAAKFAGIKQRQFVETGLDAIKNLCGSSYNTVGPYIATSLVMKFSPNVKSIERPALVYGEGQSGELQRLTRQPIITSSLIPDAIRFAQDCITVMKYANDAHIGNSIATCFKAPLIESPDMLAQNLSNCLSFFPHEMLEFVFTKEEHAALISFFAAYMCTAP